VQFIRLKVMCFALKDAGQRTFRAQRVRCRGSIDNFIDRRIRALDRCLLNDYKYEPNVRTRNHKPLVKPSQFGEAWELRVGPDNRFRVFYRFDEPVNHVRVLAIAEKRGEKLYVGGKEFVP
jgi:hypothetical protein